MGPPVKTLREESNQTAALTDAEMLWLLEMMSDAFYVVTDVYIRYGMAARFDKAWVVHPDHYKLLTEEIIPNVT